MTVTPTVLREYDRSVDPPETESATFGLGCFWGPDTTFGAVDGVVRTRVGYAGGSKAGPTYRSLGNHSEVIQVEFDPDAITYRGLLATAFHEHNPRRQTAKRQYQNIVLTADDSQHETVLAYIADSDFSREQVETRIEPLDQFYPAEDYHQKYNLRAQGEHIELFEELGYDDEDVRESPAAAKLNGHAAGHEITAEHGLGLVDGRTGRSR